MKRQAAEALKERCGINEHRRLPVPWDGCRPNWYRTEAGGWAFVRRCDVVEKLFDGVKGVYRRPFAGVPHVVIEIEPLKRAIKDGATSLVFFDVTNERAYPFALANIWRVGKVWPTRNGVVLAVPLPAADGWLADSEVEPLPAQAIPDYNPNAVRSE